MTILKQLVENINADVFKSKYRMTKAEWLRKNK
jgi:hypothetical protein